MRRFAYAKPLNLPELENELRAAGLDPALVEGHPPVDGVAPPGGIVWFADDDPVTAAQVAAAVAAHDAAAIDRAAEQTAADDAADRDLARQAIATLLADAARLEDATQVLSPQQIRHHLARADKTLAALARVLRRRDLI